jgi:LuxR family transcriptional regulator, maltose regulon positive regulatory protein
VNSWARGWLGKGQEETVDDAPSGTFARALLVADDLTQDVAAGNGIRLLEAKLTPPRVPSGFVLRPRISRAFESGLAKPLTIVSAGPGWGKTLAAAAWAESGRTAASHIAWVSLDDGDSTPFLFWSYVLAALRRTGAVPQDNPLAELVAGPVFDNETTRRIAHGLSRLPRPVALVLDDFQEIHDRVVLHSIDALLRHPISQLRVVLITRSDPMLSLHRLRLNSELTEIRAADLAFRGDEAATLFAQHGVNVNASLTRLLEWTEGWPAGLRLVALSLQHDSSGAQLDGITYESRSVADYLATEVLAAQPDELRRFLLHTSISDKLTGDLANAITADDKGEQRLDQLERANAFVVGLGGSGHWYRYHPMMRDMLRHQLSMQEPGVVVGLHRRAAKWFAAHDHPVEAMQHAVSARDWKLLGRLLVTRTGPRLLSADRGAVGRILDQLPEADDEDGVAEVYLSRAARSVLRPQFEGLDAHLARAWESLPRIDPDVRPAAQVVLHLLSTLQGRIVGDVDAVVSQSANALDVLRGEAVTVSAANDYTIVALNNHGMGLLWSGADKEAERSLREALGPLPQGPEVTRMNALGHLGLIVAGRGRLRTAHEYATAAVDLANVRGWQTLEQVSAAYLALALVNFHWNDLEEADRLLHLGLAAQPSHADRLPFTAIQITQVRVLTARGRLAHAGELLRELVRLPIDWQPPAFLRRWQVLAEAELDLVRGDAAGAVRRLTLSDEHSPIADQERVCMARALLGKGEFYQAEQLVAPLREFAIDRAAEVEAWLITAVTADSKREDHRANAAVQRAIFLAKDEEIRRPFTLFDTQGLPRLLAHTLRVATAAAGITREFLEGVLRDEERPFAGGLIEPLTDRELTVLEHLPTMLSNAEIASEMYVSVNTVKAHLKTLYRKLDVSSRREAVARGRVLNLLSHAPRVDGYSE